MAETLAYKILKNHIVSEDKDNLEIKIDYTLTQDATGTMAYLEFMSMGIDKVKTDLSVSYVDHNTLQSGFENADDHLFLQTVADKYGIVYSKAGNGICHQLQAENFTKPGITLLGSDSHTPTSGGLGAIAIGAGGLDIALSMAGRPFRMPRPEIINVQLSGKLKNGVTSKDVILELLRRLSVKGGVNKIFEYTGEGVKTLSVPERCTICNMGAELGATTSVFPSDERTRDFLKMQGREADYIPLSADENAEYSNTIEIDLSKLCALAACPSSPDNVKPVSELQNTKINQVLIGSCTNSSYLDMAQVASILKGHKIHKDVSLGINPGSRNVLEMISRNGMLYDIIQSGARILECTCGPCIGMGQSPASNAVSVRTYNRNFYGRSGTNSAEVYLCSPVTAAFSAIKGFFTDPTDTKEELNKYENPKKYITDKSMFIEPTFSSKVIMGPNIKPIPKFNSLPSSLECRIILKTEDNISTDHIMPAGAKVLPYRSNIEKLSDFCFMNVKPDFKNTALETVKKEKECIIVAGSNYGQGSSREHAAIVPRYLGVRAVLAKSFARIHRQNLINFGIIPLEITEDLYNILSTGMDMNLNSEHLEEGFVEIGFILTEKAEEILCSKSNNGTVTESNKNTDIIRFTDNKKTVCYRINVNFTEKEINNIKKGGLLNV